MQNVKYVYLGTWEKSISMTNVKGVLFLRELQEYVNIVLELLSLINVASYVVLRIRQIKKI